MLCKNRVKKPYLGTCEPIRPDINCSSKRRQLSSSPRKVCSVEHRLASLNLHILPLSLALRFFMLRERRKRRRTDRNSSPRSQGSRSTVVFFGVLLSRVIRSCQDSLEPQRHIFAGSQSDISWAKELQEWGDRSC